MKIKVIRKDRNLSYTIDIGESKYPWQLREAYQQALLLEGYTQEMVNEVFNIVPDCAHNSREKE